MVSICEGIHETIGNTPLVKIKGPFVPPGKSLFLKLEYFNPTFSIKDRTAFALVRSAMESGRLVPGGTIIESSSGNLGKALAALGAEFGFKVILVIDPKISEQTTTLYRVLGATVVMVKEPDPDGGFQTSRIRKVREILEQRPDIVWLNQYENSENPKYHYEVTAEELLSDALSFDCLIGAVSTGGHLCGISRRIKERRPATKIVACDSAGSAIFQPNFRPYVLNGIGLSWKTKNVDEAVLDYTCLIDDEDAISACWILARQSGVLVGGSGGATFFGCLVALHTLPVSSALGLIPDTGHNYLDQIYDQSWLKAKNIRINSEGDMIRRAVQYRLDDLHKKIA